MANIRFDESCNLIGQKPATKASKRISKWLICLSTSGNYTHLEIVTGNRNRTNACAMPLHCSDH